MRLGQSFLVAIKRLKHRPVRSFLLLQGTIWGVGVSLLQPAIFAGTRREALEHGSTIGADRVTFAADPTGVDAASLVRDDVPVVRAAVEGAGVPVTAIAGVRVEHAKVAAGPVQDVVYGPPEAPTSRGITLAQGRLLDPKATERELVVEGLLAEDLAKSGLPVLGALLDAPSGTPGRIVGVLAPRAPLQRRANDLGFDTEHPMFKRVTGGLMVALGFSASADAWKRTDRCAYALSTDERVDWILLRVPSTEVRKAKNAGEAALLARGKAPIIFYPPIYPMLLANELDRFKSVTLALFLACLVMGGVVMANVGLLAALRRAPEIAVHRVEGAQRKDIAAQFLAEGAILSVLGTLGGYAVAVGLASGRVALEPMAGIAWTFPWPEAVVAFVASFVIGVGACLLPALRAANQDPVEGLVADE